MDFRQIKNLMKEFEDSTIQKIEICDGEFSIKMEKENKYNPIVKSPLVLDNSFVDTKSVKELEQVETDQVNNNVLVKSPLVGTYYQASSPDSEPFIEINKKVNKGDVLFIVEAMKVMNEITSPVSGTVVKIMAKDNTMVEFNQIVIEISN